MIEVGRNIDRNKLLALLLFSTGRIAHCVKSGSHHDRHANPIKKYLQLEIQLHCDFSVRRIICRDVIKIANFSNTKLQRIDAEYFHGGGKFWYVNQRVCTYIG